MRDAFGAFLLLAGLWSWPGVQLQAQVVADAGADATICAGDAVTLGGAAATGGTPPYQYSWAPPVGLSDADILHPVCTSAITRTYTLTVTDAAGATATDQVTVTVLPSPTVVLTSTNAPGTLYGGVTTFSICGLGASNYAFDLADASTAQPGASYTIDWGNGQPAGNFAASGWTATQTYPLGLSTGTYTVQNPGAGSCATTIPFNLFVGEVPLGGLSVVSSSTICTGSAISFEWNNFSANPPGTLYIVDYGDGVTDTLPHPPQAAFSHTYATSSCAVAGGEFAIAWRITNPCDTRTGGIGQIRVSESPVAGFTLAPNDTVCTNSTVTFTGSSQGQQAPACSAPKHIWSISPTTGWTAAGALGSMNGQPTMPNIWTTGATSLGVSFTVPGTYTITGTTGNQCGIDALVRTICVEAPPQPAFTLSATAGCTPLVSTVDNTSSSPNSCFTRYNWLPATTGSACGGSGTAAFTGGSNASSFEPQFTFTGAGNYTVTLQAINSCGTYPVVLPVSVGAPPEVQVNALNGICEGQSVSPSATFEACGSPITSVFWNLNGGNPSTATTQTPGTVTFPSSGNFNLVASATNGCGTGSSSTVLPVTPLPAAPVVGGPITLCVGEPLSLSASGPPGTTFTWTGPNGFSSTSASPSIPAITLAGQGTYVVSASAGGCSGPSSTVDVTVNPAPVVSISPVAPSACAGEAVTLTASGGTNFQWSVSGVNIGSGTPFTFTPTASTTVVLQGDASGCTGATSTLVTVHPLPVVDAGQDRTFCESNDPQLLFPNSFGGTWSGHPNVTADGYFTPSTQGSFELIYTVVSPTGCTGSDTMTVTVNPPSTPADAGPDMVLCQHGPPVQLGGTPAGGTWSGAVSIGGSFDPVDAGTFTVNYFVGSGSCSSSDQATITVNATPAVDPGADEQVCIDAPAFGLSATPIGGSWSGAGISGSTFDPLVAGVGQHPLTYTYTDANGCATPAVRMVTVDPLPVVIAGNDTTFCDQPFAQQLVGFSPAGGTWSGPQVAVDGAFLPAGAGTFPLTYAYTDGNGCAASDGITVTVITIDNPATAGNDTARCLNSGVLQLAGAPADGTWSGLHVDAAGAFDPVQEGSFTLTYSVGSGSCVTQDQVEVTVHPLPAIDLTGVANACVDAGAQTFTATPPGGSWSGTGITDAAAGSFDPALAGAGSFPITYAFTDANGCFNSATADVTVHPLPVAAFTHDPIACTNLPFAFTDASTGATAWAWDFGDGGSSALQSPSHTYTAAGSYTVTLSVTSVAGCTSTSAQAVTVWAGPTVAFAATPVDGCAPLLVSLDNQSFGDGLSYAWDLGDGSSSTAEEPGAHTYFASQLGDTTYTITLTATNSCGSVDSSRTITVHPLPTANFGPDFNSGCSPWVVTFSNTTIGQADSFHWDFGDGTSSTTTDSLVQHTYYAGATDSVYTVTLIAGNACGTDTATYNITATPNTITAFFNTDTTSGCAPLTVHFTQYSIGATNWHWELGDGNVSTEQHVANTYSTAGTYTATLFADNGCSFDTVSVVITVLETPPADFDVLPGLHCVGAPVQFSNNTPSPAGLSWDFGDGGSSTLSAPTHSYAAPGSYNVTLSVASTLGPCPAMATQTVQVLTSPVAAFTPAPESGCIPLDVQFTNGSSNADFHQWDFGDGNTSGLANPQHTYATAGLHQVRLVAEHINGCTDTAYADVAAFPLPVSAFTMAATQSCTVPASLALSDASTGAVSLAWDFGNGSGSALNNPVATFDAPGTYTVTLTVANQYGCTDVSTQVFTVHPTPVAQFTAQPQPSCAGYPVSFTNTSLHSSSFQWRLGDGTVSTAEHPVHTYAEGDFDVLLIVTGAGGCTDTLLVPQAIHVDPRPTAGFSYSPMQSTTYALQFHNESVGAVSWVWDFGDGEQSTEHAPLHLFPAGPGDLYPFCLVAINSFGCPDTLCQPVVAVTTPGIFAPNAFTPDQDGLNEDFLPVLNGFADWRYEFLIFDRWGELIHQSRNRHVPWDGRYKGKPVKSDVYVWKVVLNRHGDERVYYGHVTVVRGSE